MPDYYSILGVDRNISQKDLKKHYYRLAKKYHPDTGNTDPEMEVRFKRINEAYNALSTPQKRQQYHQRGMYGRMVVTQGFTAISRKEKIINRLNTQVNFSLDIFADELQVTVKNLRKAISKFIRVYNYKAEIIDNRVVFH